MVGHLTKRVTRRAAATALTLTLPLLVGGCGGAEAERSVPMPPVGASPREVVETYLDALDGQDVRTAKALMTPEAVGYAESTADSWFDNVVSIRPLELRETVFDENKAVVKANLQIKQRRAMSIPNGKFGWDYSLTRDATSGRWLIADQGQG